MHRTLPWQTLLTCLMMTASISTLAAEPQLPTGQTLTADEQKFADLLSEATMVGTFTIDGQNAPPKPEQYVIQSASKLKDDTWIIQARITYGKVDVPVPVPVHVMWAGDTPVIQVTDLTLPGLGSGFTARVMFYEDRYAGTWSHGKVGGHMLGKVQPTEKSDPPKDDSQPSQD